MTSLAAPVDDHGPEEEWLVVTSTRGVDTSRNGYLTSTQRSWLLTRRSCPRPYKKRQGAHPSLGPASLVCLGPRAPLLAGGRGRAPLDRRSRLVRTVARQTL